MTLNKRKLGGEGLAVGAIGLGCMGMSQSYGHADERESIKTLHRAIELGCNFFDTAEGYGPFTNEELLGRAFRDRRDSVILATKFGFRFENGRQVGAETDSSPASIRRAVEGSLRRMQTDHIDLLYQHRIDRKLPIEDVANTVGELVREGKVRFFGLSEVGVANLRRAHAVHPVSALQSEYSLWERNLESDIIPVLRELNIGLVPFCPLGRGFLAGGVKRAEDYPEGDTRRNDPRYQGNNYDANVAAAQIVFDMATSKGVKAGQIALAWLLHKGDHIVPIPGTKRRAYLEENVAAEDIRLSPEEMQKLDAALATGTVSGNRYSDFVMATIDR
jgi:aryl-alcohol dehydrogenase-like predicted oxidoreductase